MSSQDNTASRFDPVVQPFIDFWSSYVKQADDFTREYLEGLDGGEEVRTWQRRWFDAVSKSMDAYMRTPAFLQGIKQRTELAIKAKRQAQDVTAEIARNVNIPTATDISGLFERLRSVEDVILSRLDRIEDRLHKLEQKT